MISAPTSILTAILIVLVLVLPRKYLLTPLVVATCFLPSDQRIIILDLDFTCLRMLILAVVCRLVVRSEVWQIQWNRFDRLLLAWALSGAIIYWLQWTDSRAAIYKSGRLFDILGLYWIFRQTIESWDDVIHLVRVFTYCALIMVPFVVYEKSTGWNPFSMLGRVETVWRQGKVRCMAAFPHSIMMGVFWASLLPVFLARLITDPRSSLWWAAAGAAGLMVWATASSTPYASAMAGLLLLAMFPIRQFGRYIAFSACAATVALHIVMKAPVWHLLARIDLAGGSTGWHRFHLIDQAIRHFPQWMLLGTRDTSHWGYHLFDVTNEYIFQGVEGGFLTLTLFVVLLIAAVRSLQALSLAEPRRSLQWIVWSVCVSLLVHCVGFISVAYFGQIHMLLYMILAIAGMSYGQLSSAFGELSAVGLPTVWDQA